jgi:hypothetical protein
VADLFAITDLEGYLRKQVDPAAAHTARRLAQGWLLDATKLPGWPQPVPDDLWAWAVELAGIAYEHPAGGTREDVGDVSYSGWGLRRAEILAAASRKYAAPALPRGAFPAPLPWPVH